MNLWQNHIFAQSLRGRAVDVLPSLERLSSLTEERIEDLVEGVPEGWRQWVDRVKRHVLELQESVEQLEIELRRCVV
jgi:hypothetical protein